MHTVHCMYMMKANSFLVMQYKSTGHNNLLSCLNFLTWTSNNISYVIKGVQKNILNIFLHWKLGEPGQFQNWGTDILPPKSECILSYFSSWHECSYINYNYHLLYDQCDLEWSFKYFLTLKTDWTRSISILGCKEIALENCFFKIHSFFPGMNVLI